MLLLIDGYNLIGPVAPPGRGATTRWLQAERSRLIQKLAKHLGDELSRETMVVFDAAGMSEQERERLGLESQFVEQSVSIEFAASYTDADERIIELISQHSAPKRLTIVSSDHRIQVAARRRGALAVDSESWLDALEGGRVELAIQWPPGSGEEKMVSNTDPKSIDEQLPRDEINHWLKQFKISDADLRDLRATKNPFPEGYGDDIPR